MTKRCEIFSLKFLLIMTAVLFGGFYEFVSCIVSAVLGVYLLYILYKKKKLRLYWNGPLILSAVTAAGYAVSVITAVDRGMALIGVIKFLPLVLFALAYMQLSEEERDELLFTVPLSGALIMGMSFLLCWIPAVREHLFMAGRLGGTFQYSNTMALYLLTGVILIQGRKTAQMKHLLLSGLLILGIFLTGSRSVFILTAAVLTVSAWRRREWRVFNMSILTAAVAAGVIYSYITGDYQNLGRFLTISLKNSTFIGRFLYWQDALPLVAAHPFGLGYMGYFYLQGTIQTGVYTTVFVHNDLLQIFLDTGWIPGLVFAAVFLKSMFSNRLDHTRKAVLAVIGVHCLLDFDMQFLSIGVLFLMALDSRKKENALFLKKGACTGIVAAMLASLYFLIPLAASYTGNYELARMVYPCYTEANTALLKNAETREEGEKLADAILKTNQNVALACDAKALSSAMDEDFEQMIIWKERAVENNPYALYEYVDYVSLLSRAVDWSRLRNDRKMAAYYEKCMREIPQRLEALKERTSPLGWKIRDLPETELPQEITEYINSLGE